MEKIIDKIEKLLALAEKNPNENEAMAAAAKAQELMAKYNIQMAQLGNNEEKPSQKIGTAMHENGKGYKWRYTLAQVVARNFRCKNYIVGRNAIVFYGFESDAQIALSTFTFLFNVGNRLAIRAYVKQKNEGKNTKGFLNTYLKGFCDGVASVLDEQCKALMLVVPKEVNEAFTEMSRSWRRINTEVRTTTDYETYNNGKTAGREAMQSRHLEA